MCWAARLALQPAASLLALRGSFVACCSSPTAAAPDPATRSSTAWTLPRQACTGDYRSFLPTHIIPHYSHVYASHQLLSALTSAWHDLVTAQMPHAISLCQNGNLHKQQGQHEDFTLQSCTSCSCNATSRLLHTPLLLVSCMHVNVLGPFRRF